MQKTLSYPAAIDMVRVVLDESAVDKLKTLPLSIDTMSRWTEEMSDALKQETTAQISAHFTLQMDKRTDTANHAILLLFVK